MKIAGGQIPSALSIFFYRLLQPICLFLYLHYLFKFCIQFVYNNCCDFLYTFLVSYNAQNIYLVKSLILTLLKVIIGTPPLIMKKKWKKKLNDFAIIRLLFLSGTLNFSGIKNPKESFRTLFVAQKCKKIITAVPKNVNCFPTFRHACYIVRLPAIPSQWNKLLTHTCIYSNPCNV